MLAKNSRGYVRARIGMSLIIAFFTGISFMNTSTETIGSMDNLYDNLGLFYLMTANMFLINV